MSLVEVVIGAQGGMRRVDVAQALGEEVAVVGVRGGRAPGIVAPMAQQHVLRQAGEGRTLGVDSPAVEVELEQYLGGVVVDLWAHHRQRMARARMGSRDQ